MKSWVEKQRDIALVKARSFARSSNFTWAQLWVNRAASFYPVTERQLANVQRLYDRSRKNVA